MKNKKNYLKDLIKNATNIRKKEGNIYFIKEILSYIYRRIVRLITPAIGYKTWGTPIIYEGIKIGQKEKIFDKYVPSLDRLNVTSKIELGLRLGHIALTQMGDHVVIIGGGNGISATEAGRQIGKKGKLTIYDGMTGEKNHKFGLRHIDKTLKLNKIQCKWNLKHGWVTTKDNTVRTYRRNYRVPIIHPLELPDCDVLEFDCNGAELEILRNMKIKPRALIIELEAPFYKELYGSEAHPRDVLKELFKLGYLIIKQTGHEGKPINYKNLLELIDKEYETGEKQQLNSGAKDSPVILAIRKDYFKKKKK